MRREIAWPVDRGFLGVADRDRADTGFADLGLERHLDAARLQPHVERLEPAAGLHPYDLAAGLVAFEPQHGVELAQADERAAVVGEGRCDGEHRADRMDRYLGTARRHGPPPARHHS